MASQSVPPCAHRFQTASLPPRKPRKTREDGRGSRRNPVHCKPGTNGGINPVLIAQVGFHCQENHGQLTHLFTRGGCFALVAEPYFSAMGEQQWEEVRRFAIKYDLEYLVVPNSYHEPGDTIRILFGHEEFCPDLMPWIQSGDSSGSNSVSLEGRIEN